MDALTCMPLLPSILQSLPLRLPGLPTKPVLFSTEKAGPFQDRTSQYDYLLAHFHFIFCSSTELSNKQVRQSSGTLSSSSVVIEVSLDIHDRCALVSGT